jgi:hypothetical protein
VNKHGSKSQEGDDEAQLQRELDELAVTAWDEEDCEACKL